MKYYTCILFLRVFISGVTILRLGRFMGFFGVWRGWKGSDPHAELISIEYKRTHKQRVQAKKNPEYQTQKPNKQIHEKTFKWRFTLKQKEAQVNKDQVKLIGGQTITEGGKQQRQEVCSTVRRMREETSK